MSEHILCKESKHTFLSFHDISHIVPFPIVNIGLSHKIFFYNRHWCQTSVAYGKMMQRCFMIHKLNSGGKSFVWIKHYIFGRIWSVPVRFMLVRSKGHCT